MTPIGSPSSLKYPYNQQPISSVHTNPLKNSNPRDPFHITPRLAVYSSPYCFLSQKELYCDLGGRRATNKGVGSWQPWNFRLWIQCPLSVVLYSVFLVRSLQAFSDRLWGECWENKCLDKGCTVLHYLREQHPGCDELERSVGFHDENILTDRQDIFVDNREYLNIASCSQWATVCLCLRATVNLFVLVV